MHLFTKQQLVLVKVLYYMPDHKLILNEFTWQTNDVWPQIPRVHQFLNYWREHIEAPINTVEVAAAYGAWRSVECTTSIG